MSNQSTLDVLTNAIEQGFMQRGGWKECRYLLGKLVAEKDAEINRLEQRLQETDAGLHRARQILVHGEKAVKAAGGE